MTTLLDDVDGIVCDLDGVVYAGKQAVPHAVAALEAARREGRPIVYATNNASRPPESVAEHLRALGLTCEPQDVVNSSQAGAGLVAERVEAGATVLAVGGPGVAQALRERGFEAVTPQQRIDDPSVAGRISAVLQGYGTDIAWADLAEAAYAIRDGAAWVATNTDLTIPTGRGIAPGNGSLVRAVGYAAGIEPVVAGKPHPPLYQAAADRLGLPADRLLAVGDRLDTDIEGAYRADMRSLLVLTGINGLADAAAAPVEQRPTFVASDLRALQAPMPSIAVEGAEARCGDARARVDDGGLTVEGEGDDAVRAALAACWSAVDGGALPAELSDDVRATLDGLDPRVRSARG